MIYEKSYPDIFKAHYCDYFSRKKCPHHQNLGTFTMEV